LPAQTAAYAPPAAASVRINFNPGWRLAKGSHPVDGTDDAGREKGDHYDCAVLRAAIAKQPASAPAKSQPGENHGSAK
jgi:hypothetical protein